MPPDTTARLISLPLFAALFALVACNGTPLSQVTDDPVHDAGSTSHPVPDSGMPQLVDAGTPPPDAGHTSTPDSGTTTPDAGHTMTPDAGHSTGTVTSPPVITTNGYAGSIGLQKISPANYSTLALRNGAVHAVGEVSHGTFSFPLPAGATIVDIATAGHSDAVLDSTGRVWMWYAYEGDGNTSGDMGDGKLYTSDSYYTPVQLMTDVTGQPFDHVAQLIPAFEDVYAIKDDGTVWAWGSNASGEAGGPLPTGDCPWLTRTGPVPGTDVKCYALRPTQIPFPAGTVIKKMAVSGSDTPIALDSLGQVWLWGSDTLVNGAFQNSNVPVKVTGIPTTHAFIDVAAGLEHALVLDDQGRIYGWGPGHGGAYLGLGNGVNTWSPQSTPIELTNLPAFSSLRGQVTRIASAEYASYALDAAGNLYAWGDQTIGDVGTRSTGISRGIGITNANNWNWGTAQDMVMTPTLIKSNILQVYGTYAYSVFAVDSAGAVWGWGRDKFGNLGDGCAAQDAATQPDVCDVGQPKSVMPF